MKRSQGNAVSKFDENILLLDKSQEKENSLQVRRGALRGEHLVGSPEAEFARVIAIVTAGDRRLLLE